MEYIISLLLVGLGLQTPSFPAVLGDDDVKIEKKELKMERKQNLQELKAQKTASREAMKEEQKSRREEFKAEIEEKREMRKEEFKERREAFKERLEKIKDERKKDIVSRADTRLMEINTNRTNIMTDHLNKMDEVIAKLTQKIEQFEDDGKDVSSAKTAVSKAQAAISVAKTAVLEQAAKEYIIGVTTENKLGQDLKRSIEAMRKDLAATQELIKEARKAITDAVKGVALVGGSN